MSEFEHAGQADPSEQVVLDAPEEEPRSEITAAQARTTRLQRRTRWTLAVTAVAVGFGLGLGIWQLNIRQRALDEAHVNLLTEQAAVNRSHPARFHPR